VCFAVIQVATYFFKDSQGFPSRYH
jgi:hypothetical protein